MKIAGIVMVVLPLMAYFGWAISYSEGKSGTESPAFYLFLLIILVVGIILISKSKKK